MALEEGGILRRGESEFDSPTSMSNWPELLYNELIFSQLARVGNVWAHIATGVRPLHNMRNHGRKGSISVTK